MRNTKRNPYSRVWLATAALCCGYFGIATANTGNAGLAVTQLPAGLFSRSLSNLSTDIVIELGSSIRRGELRDDGQLFLVDNNGGALPANRVLTNGGALTLAGRLIDLQGSISASGRGNVTLTAGGDDYQGLLTGNDMRLSAGAKISATGRGDTLMIAPAGYVHSASRSFNHQFHRDGEATVDSYRRHAHATFLSTQHWNSEDRRHDRRDDGHSENGEHHAGYYAGHHGGGPRWNFNDGYEYCEISPSIPEPRSYALMLAGLLLLWAVRRRQKNNARSDASA